MAEILDATENPAMTNAPGRRPDSVDAVGERLRLTREASGYPGRKQAEFARFVQISENAWNHYELGRRLIPPHEALKLRRKVGASLDWIYNGDQDGNSARLNTGLARLREDKTQPARRAV